MQQLRNLYTLYLCNEIYLSINEEAGEGMKQYEELVQKAKFGDANAFAEIYQEIYKELYRFALYTLKNSHDAEDVVSDTILDAWKEIRSLRQAAAFKGWIFRILTNKCKMRLKQYVDKMMELPEDIMVIEPDHSEVMDVRGVFATLQDEERLILAMNLFGGYSSREIGEQLGISDNTVRSKQSRALKKMETMLVKSS